MTDSQIIDFWVTLNPQTHEIEFRGFTTAPYVWLLHYPWSKYSNLVIFLPFFPYIAKIYLKPNEFKVDEAKNMLEYVFDSAESESVIRNKIWLNNSVKNTQYKNVWEEVRIRSYIKPQLRDRIFVTEVNLIWA